MALRRAASLMTLLAKQAAEEETDPGSADRRRHSRPDELQFRDNAVTANEYAANPSQGDAIIGTPPPQQSATFDHRAWQRHLKRQYQRLKQLPDETPRQALAQRGGEAGGGGGDSSSDSDDSRNDKQVTTAQQDATAEAAGASPSPSGPAIDMTETDEQVIKRTASGRTTSYWRFREWVSHRGNQQLAKLSLTSTRIRRQPWAVIMTAHQTALMAASHPSLSVTRMPSDVAVTAVRAGLPQRASTPTLKHLRSLTLCLDCCEPARRLLQGQRQ